MKYQVLVSIILFNFLGVIAKAETCYELCRFDFWITASKADIIAEISKADVNARDQYGATALMSSSLYANIDNLKILIDAGADVNARIPELGVSVLMRASTSMYANPETLKLLIKAGADVRARTLRGDTSLMFAATNPYPENIKTLLKAGADINARNLQGSTPLMFAAKFGTSENVKVLLEAGADTVFTRNDGKTAWNLAQENDELKYTEGYWMLNDTHYK